MQTIKVNAQNNKPGVNSYNIHYHGELMKNYLAADQFDKSNDMKVVSDVDGNPIIFQQQGDDVRIIYHDPESHTGWRETSIKHLFYYRTTGKTDYDSIAMEAWNFIAFDVYQKNSNEISVGFFNYQGPSIGIMYFIFDNVLAKPCIWKKEVLNFPMYSGNYDFAQNPDSTTKKSDIPSNLFIKISSTGTKPDNKPLVCLMSNIDKNQFVGFADLKNSKPGGSENQFGFDFNITDNNFLSVKDFYIGKWGENNAVFLASEGEVGWDEDDDRDYVTAANNLRIFVYDSNPDIAPKRLNYIEDNPNYLIMDGGKTGNNPKPKQKAFGLINSIPLGYEWIDNIAVSTDFSGKNPSYFYLTTDGNSNPTFGNAAIPNNPKLVKPKKLLGGLTSFSTLVWTLDENGELFCSFFDNKFANQGWSPHLHLGKDIANIAIFNNFKAGTLELVYTKESDGSLHHMYQDPGSTLWRTENIVSPNPSESVEFTSFTTELSVWENGNVPMPLQEFDLSATEQMYVIVNHVLQKISPKTPIKVKTDSNGKLTIVNRTEGLASPRFILKFYDFQNQAVIDPAAKVNERLGRIKSGGNLNNAKTQGGQAVFDGVNQNKLDHAGKALAKLHHLANHLNNNGQTFADFDPNTEVFGMKDIQTNPKFIEKEEAKNHFKDLEGGIEELSWHSFKHFCGGVLHSVEHDLEKVGDWVIKMKNGVAHFIIKLGGKLFKFVLEFATQVFKVINWLFKTFLGINLEKLIEWLGFIFEWKDIIHTSKELKKLCENSFKMLKAIGVKEESKGWIENAFADLNLKITGNELDKQQFKQPISKIGQHVKHKQSNQLKADPRSNFGHHHLTSPAAVQSASGGGNLFSSDLTSDIERVLTDLGYAEFDEIKDAFIEIANAIHQKPLKDCIEYIVEILGETFIAEIKKAVLAFRELLADLVDAIDNKNAINKEWKIPVLSTIYEEIAKEKLTILNVSCLVIAIPITIGYKIYTGEKPFTPGQTEYTNQLFKKFYREKLSDKIQRTIKHDQMYEEAEQPAKHTLNSNLILGGFGTTSMRAGLGFYGSFMVNTPGLSDEFFLIKSGLSFLSFGITVMNKIVLEEDSMNRELSGGGTSTSDSGKTLEDIMVWGQGIWPVYDVISNSESARPVIGKISCFTGVGFSFSSIVLFFVLEEGKEKEIAKFYENLGFGISKTISPAVIKFLIDLPNPVPELTKAIQVLNLLSYASSAGINIGRAIEARSNEETFKPI